MRSFLVLLLLVPVLLLGQTDVPRITITGKITSNTTWSPDNEYLLSGLVYVTNGAVLTILPGTHIFAEQTSGGTTSALIITRGCQIIADGTADAPIIFTSELDDLSDPYDLTKRDRALWGGLILLGKANTNKSIAGVNNLGFVEGIAYNVPPLPPLVDQELSLYGWGDLGLTGPIDNDNSGIVRYVSIRHGGFELSDANEINGLTMGAVGSGTTIEYVEVYANDDDGFEWFGGTVNCKYLVSAYCDDDDFDLDEGYAGKVQFAFAVKDTLVGGGRICEWDGGVSPNQNDPPFADATFSNMTAIGPGNDARGVLAVGDGAEMFDFRDNTYADLYNFIAVAYDNKLARAESDISASQCELVNGYIFDMNPAIQIDGANTFKETRDLVTVASSPIVAYDPELPIDPHPQGAATTAAQFGADTELADPFFTVVTYLGAFSPTGDLWINKWTCISQEGDIVSSVTSNLSAGWSLVGLPVIPEDLSVDAVYPVRQAIFAWTGSQYQGPSQGLDTLNAPAEGYWLNLASSQAITYDGVNVISYDVAFPNDGWYIISPPENMDVVDIIDPQGVLQAIFGWTGSQYQGPSQGLTSLQADKGYWVNVNVPGSTAYIRFQSQPSVLPKNIAPELNLSDSYVTVEDAAGNSIDLYFAVEMENAGFYELPPAPPAGAGFDARLSSGHFASAEKSGSIKLMANDYPVRLSATRPMQIELGDSRVYLNAGESYELKSPVEGFSVSLDAEAAAAVPEQFEVLANYPNPFNPETQIRFNIPERVNVDVVIFNAVGQKVKTLVSGTLEAGFHSYKWNGTDERGMNVSSGVYYYTVKAGSNSATQKMLLVK